MKKLLFAALIFLPVLSSAATGSVNIAWTLPTLAEDGTALTGAQAITSVQVFLGTATIPSTATPTATLTATATTTTQTLTVSPGQKIYARVKACNSAGCSAFSTEVTKDVPVAVPGVPTNVTITLTIS